MSKLLDGSLGSSRWYWVLVGVFVVLVFGLSYLAGLSLWQLAVLLLVFVVLLWSSHHKPIPIHLTQLPDDEHWQLLMQTGRGEQLWQGRLVAVKSYRFGVHLTFEIDEPLITSLQCWVFFDQLDDDDRRKLKLATAFW